MAPETLGDVAIEKAAGWREFLAEADDSYLRGIPEPGVNSPIQYGAHVRDILKVYGGRMALALEQDNPTVPMFNPPQEVWEVYNRMDAGELASDIEAQAGRLAELVSGMGPSDWSRIVINDRGQYGVYTFTVAGLARNAVHEAHHHLLDAKGTLSLGAMP
jgi:DinB superfamily